MQKKIFFFVIVFLVIGTIVAVLIGSGGTKNVSSTKYDTFAQCLATKKLTMYGASWCTHCKAQKERFEGSFKYVPYVECTENAKECLDKGVEGYPTWIDANGTKYVGEQELQKLSDITSCPLPTN